MVGAPKGIAQTPPGLYVLPMIITSFVEIRRRATSPSRVLAIARVPASLADHLAVPLDRGPPADVADVRESRRGGVGGRVSGHDDPCGPSFGALVRSCPGRPGDVLSRRPETAPRAGPIAGQTADLRGRGPCRAPSGGPPGPLLGVPSRRSLRSRGTRRSFLGRGTWGSRTSSSTSRRASGGPLVRRPPEGPSFRIRRRRPRAPERVLARI